MDSNTKSDDRTTPEAVPTPSIGSAAVDAMPAPTDSEPTAGDGGSTVRWWSAVVVGGGVSVGLGWFLSYAAALPFYLGVFFFLVVGLVIGAVVFRVASPGRPYRRTTILCGTSIIVLIGWGATIAIEARNFPNVVARKAQKRTLSIGHRTAEAYRHAVSDGVRDHLRQSYPPGGLVGYVRWVLANKELTKGDVAELRRPMSFPVTGKAWVIRVLLCLGLLGFGIASQTWPLRIAFDPPPKK